MKGLKIIGGIILGLGIGALIYFGVTAKAAPKKDEPKKDPDAPPSPSPTPTPTPTPPVTTIPAPTGFPLIVGMKNNSDVRDMQNALIKKFPGTISAGATGNFGAQTVAALAKGGYIPPISKAEFNNILAGRNKGETAVDPKVLKNGDMVRMKEDTSIYSGVGAGFIGTIPKGKDARYVSPSVSGWAKIRTIDYYTDYFDDEKRKYVFKSQDVYVRSYLIEKKS